MSELDKYRGHPLTLDQKTFLASLKKKGFQILVTGSANKTIRIEKGDHNYGYINSTVLRFKGIFGYRFELFEGKDACPKRLEETIEKEFKNHYSFRTGWICHFGTGSNRDNKYLIITDMDLANKVVEIE